MLTSYNISYFTDVIFNPKLYLNLWVCDWNIFIPWKSSAIFGYLRKFLEIVWKHSWGLQTIFGESLEIFGSGRKSLENQQKTLLLVHACLYNKQNNALLIIDMKYLFLCSSLYPTLLLHLTVRHWVKHPKRYSIFTHAHVFFSISFFHHCRGRLRTVSIIQVFTSSLQFKLHKFIYSLWILRQLGKNYKLTNRPIGVHVDDNVHMYSCCS